MPHETTRVAENGNSAFQSALSCSGWVLEAWPLRSRSFHMKLVFRNELNRPIPGFSGDEPPHAPSWVGDVSGISRDQVNVRVHDGLTGGLSHVHTNVISIWVQIGVQLRIGLPDQFKRCFALIFGQREEAGNVAEGNNQQVSFADRIPIVASVAKGVPKNDVLGGGRTKWALGIHEGQQGKKVTSRATASG